MTTNKSQFLARIARELQALGQSQRSADAIWAAAYQPAQRDARESLRRPAQKAPKGLAWGAS